MWRTPGSLSGFLPVLFLLLGLLGACSDKGGPGSFGKQEIQSLCASAGASKFSLLHAESATSNNTPSAAKVPDASYETLAKMTDWVGEIALAKALQGPVPIRRIIHPHRRIMFLGSLFDNHDLSPHLNLQYNGKPLSLSFLFRVTIRVLGSNCFLGLQSASNKQAFGLALQSGRKRESNWEHDDNIFALYHRQPHSAPRGASPVGQLVSPSNLSGVTYWSNTIYSCTLTYSPDQKSITVRVSYPSAKTQHSLHTTALSQSSDNNLIYSARTVLSEPIPQGPLIFGVGATTPMAGIATGPQWAVGLQPIVQVWDLRFTGVHLADRTAQRPGLEEELVSLVMAWRRPQSTRQTRTQLFRAHQLTRNLIAVACYKPDRSRIDSKACFDLVLRYALTTGYLIQFRDELGLSELGLKQLLNNACEDAARLDRLCSLLGDVPFLNGIKITRSVLIFRRINVLKDKRQDWGKALRHYRKCFKGPSTKSDVNVPRPDKFSALPPDTSAGALYRFWKDTTKDEWYPDHLPESLEEALIPDPYYFPTLLHAAGLFEDRRMTTALEQARLTCAFFLVHIRLAHLYHLSGLRDDARRHLSLLTRPIPKGLSTMDRETLQKLKAELEEQ